MCVPRGVGAGRGVEGGRFLHPEQLETTAYGWALSLSLFLKSDHPSSVRLASF